MHRPAIIGSLVAGATFLLVGAGAVWATGPGPAYLEVQSFTAVSQNDNVARLSVTTGAEIPRQPDSFIEANPVVGLAWVDLDTARVFVTTIHPVIGRDSHQNPDGWHAHAATLAGGATAPNDFCVASVDATPAAGIQLHGDTMVVNARTGDLPVAPEAFDAAAGFTIQADQVCDSGLAVRVVENP